MTTEALLKTAVDAAHAAAQALRDVMQLPRQIREKAHLDIVTDADMAADKAMKAVIQRDWADHLILSEEDEPDLDTWQPPSGYWWVIDPVDGTNNFERGVPSWSVSVAVVKDDRVQAGVIYDVIRDDLFAAGRGSGATLNDQPIQTNNRDRLEWAMVACDWAVKQENRLQTIDLVTALLPQVRTLRCWGTAALGIAHVAAGYFDAYFHAGLKPWDLAAGMLLVEEAGGIMTRLNGSAWHWTDRDVLFSNRPLHADFTRIFAEVQR